MVIGGAEGYIRPPLLYFFMTRYIASYAGEIAAFVKSLVENTPTDPSGENGIIALKLANACIQSVKEGRRIAVQAS